MKKITRLICLLVIIISVWVIISKSFYIVAEYPKLASLLISLIIYLSFVVGLSTFSPKNRTLDNIRVTIIALSFLGIFPGIYFSYRYFYRAKDSFLLKDGIIGKGIITDKKIDSRIVKTIATDHYELYYSFATSEKIITRTMDEIPEKEFEAVKVGDSVDIIYLPKKHKIFELIITDGDRRFYAKKLKSNR